MQHSHIRAVDGTHFGAEVLERSTEVPVVVDFWATWCQPCRILSPTLERLAGAAQGAWELVTVDIDREPQLAQQYQIQSIPSVKGFRDGRVVAEFLGAQPESAIRTFLTRLVPSEADQLVRVARERQVAGDKKVAEKLYRSALASQADHRAALLGLAELLWEQQRFDEAEPLLGSIPSGAAEGTRAAALLGRLRFQREAAMLAEVDDGAREDLDAMWARATRSAAHGAFGDALSRYLHIVERSRTYRNDGARKAMLSIFDILGPADALSMEYRPKLFSALH